VSAALGQIGDRIRQARTDAGLSQAELGAPHFTRAYVSAIELGKVRPAMKSLEFLATKLGQPTSYFLDDAEAVRRRLEFSAEVARASQLISQGKAAEAIDAIEPLLRRATTPRERAVLQRSLGRALTQGHRPPEAVAILNDALRYFKAAEDIDGIARTRAQLGAALNEMRSYAEGQQELESALAYMSKGDVKDPLLKVHTLYNLGVSFYMRGDYRAAAQQFDRAAREGADVGDLRWQAGLFAGMGMSYSKLGDFEAAVSYLRKSEALFEAINNRYRAVETRLRAALSLKSLGQRTKADELLTSALADARASGSAALTAEIASYQAVLWAEAGNISEGVALATQARDEAAELPDPLLLLTTQVNLAKVLRHSEPTRAADILRKAAVGAGHAHGLTYAELYSELSEILAENGLAEEALKYSRLAYKAERDK
jgi:tetratricopeptide (TPR) repeat protein